MKERPILMCGDMVRAMLEDRKTNTRRVMNPQPLSDVFRVDTYHPTIIKRGEEVAGDEVFGAYCPDGEWAIKCPYGKPGDHLWIKEAWRTARSLDHLKPSGINAGAPVEYVAGGTSLRWLDKLIDAGRYRHARFMPKWASRITLEISEIRAERLQEISEEDAIAEGLTEWEGMWGFPSDPKAHWSRDPVTAYRILWEYINGPGSWTENPHVWCISFKQSTKEKL